MKEELKVGDRFNMEEFFEIIKIEEPHSMDGWTYYRQIGMKKIQKARNWWIKNYANRKI